MAVRSPGSADLNLYAYVHGGVLRATDPLGLDSESGGSGGGGGGKTAVAQTNGKQTISATAAYTGGGATGNAIVGVITVTDKPIAELPLPDMSAPKVAPQAVQGASSSEQNAAIATGIGRGAAKFVLANVLPPVITIFGPSPIPEPGYAKSQTTGNIQTDLKNYQLNKAYNAGDTSFSVISTAAALAAPIYGAEEAVGAAAKGALEDVGAGSKGARFGTSASTDYRATFFEANPGTKGEVVVHHAVEQQTLTRYPGTVTESEIHSLENLRGIPKAINSDVHLSQIRKSWNQFYRTNPTSGQLLDHATKIDDIFGHMFNPPVR